MTCLSYSVTELQSRILAQVLRANGPVNIFTLWHEMGRSIEVGIISFVGEIAQLEREGLMEKVSGLKSALTEKGREAAQSSANILDVTPQGEKGNVWQSLVARRPVNLAAEQGPQSSVHGDAAERNTAIARSAGPSTRSLRERNERSDVTPQGVIGVSGIPTDVTEYLLSPTADSEFNVASHAPASEDALVGTGGGVTLPSSPLQQFAGERGLPQGTAKCEAVTSLDSPAIHFPADDRFADNISRAIDSFLDARDLAEQERLELIEAEREHNEFLASGYRDPAESRY